MFRSAHAESEDWRTAVESCIANLGALPPLEAARAYLGFIYVTEAMAPRLGVIVEALRASTGVADWAGAAGMGVVGDEADYFEETALAVMVADVPAGSYRLLASPDALKRAAPEGPRDDFAGMPLLVLHADASKPNTLERIEEAARISQGYLVGGLTMSRAARHQVAGVVTDSGLSGVLFQPGIGVLTSLSQGCAPIGAVHTVTRAEQNYIFELDDRRALDVLKDDIGEVLARDLRRAAGYIHAALPVQGSDTGDYVVRNLVGVDEQHGVVAIAAEVATGDRVMFVRRDSNAARDDFKAMLEKAAKRAGGKAQGALFISCIARGPNMFGERGVELQMIRDALGDVPLVGMYANGEIFNDRLYGYTGVLTLFVSE
jgi:small ligand-binding sensory domain FIST